MVEVLGRLAPVAPVRSLREGTRAAALRLARRCYDHIGGRLGVAVTDALRNSGSVEGPDGTPDLAAVRGDRLCGGVSDEVDYRLTDTGRARLAELGAVLPARLGAVRCCIDWTEQRHHIAGPLGAAVAAAFDTAGWIAPPRPTARCGSPTQEWPVCAHTWASPGRPQPRPARTCLTSPPRGNQNLESTSEPR